MPAFVCLGRGRGSTPSRTRWPRRSPSTPSTTPRPHTHAHTRPAPPGPARPSAQSSRAASRPCVCVCTRGRRVLIGHGRPCGWGCSGTRRASLLRVRRLVSRADSGWGDGGGGAGTRAGSTTRRCGTSAGCRPPPHTHTHPHTRPLLDACPLRAAPSYRDRHSVAGGLEKAGDCGVGCGVGCVLLRGGCCLAVRARGSGRLGLGSSNPAGEVPTESIDWRGIAAQRWDSRWPCGPHEAWGRHQPCGLDWACGWACGKGCAGEGILCARWREDPLETTFR
jgi:hypothetical protein